jgi:hypothetical protein
MSRVQTRALRPDWRPELLFVLRQRRGLYHEYQRFRCENAWVRKWL